MKILIFKDHQTGTYIYNASKVIANYLKPLAKNDFIISDTLSFPDMLKEAVNSEDYEDVSYDVESLFANIPVKETIEYILHKIYVEKSIKPFCKKSIFKKLLVKLTKECVFSVNSRLIKHVSVSVVFSDSFMCKMEENVVVPSSIHYVDDTYIHTQNEKC